MPDPTPAAPALTAEARAYVTATAEAARQRMASSLATEAEVREWFWLSHGHAEALYGDDGERQCNVSPLLTDFKRDPFDRLARHCTLALLAERDRLAGALDEARGRGREARDR